MAIAAVVAGGLIDPTTFGNAVVDALNPALAAWTTHTGTVTQNAGTITKTVNYSKYVQFGKIVFWNFNYNLTSTGTAGAAIIVTLPVTAAHANALSGGGGSIFDTSTSTRYGGSWVSNTTTTAIFFSDATGTSAWGTVPSLAVASGDVLEGTIIYEAA